MAEQQELVKQRMETEVVEVKHCEVVRDNWSAEDLQNELSVFGIEVRTGHFYRWLNAALIECNWEGYSDRDRQKLRRLAWFYQNLPGKRGSKTKTLKAAQALLVEDMNENPHYYPEENR